MYVSPRPDEYHFSHTHTAYLSASFISSFITASRSMNNLIHHTIKIHLCLVQHVPETMTHCISHPFQLLQNTHLIKIHFAFIPDLPSRYSTTKLPRHSHFIHRGNELSFRNLFVNGHSIAHPPFTHHNKSAHPFSSHLMSPSQESHIYSIHS